MYAGGVNFTSLLFMNVNRIYILLVWFDQKGRNFFEFIYALVLMIWQKGGEKFGVLYMHVYAWVLMFMHDFLVLYKKGENDFGCWYTCLCIYVLFMQKGKKNLVNLCMFISLFMHIYLFILMHFIEYIIVYCYTWVNHHQN